MSIEHIIHLADLHIGSGKRSQEYRDVFDKLHEVISSYNKCLVVIAGDIFHHKDKYSGDDIDDFKYLITKINHPIIIIPGNHDANLNDLMATDLLSPIVDIRPNVYYWRNSGWYECVGVLFYHLSVFDESTGAEVDAIFDEIGARGAIVLYHGMVNGATFGTHVAKETRVSTSALAKAKLVLLGDIHEHQFIGSNAAYSGSLIQQNLAESYSKGVLEWNLKTLVGRFIPIENSRGFVKIDLRGKSFEQCEQIIANIKTPEVMHKVNVVMDTNDTECNLLADSIRTKLGRIDFLSKVVTNTPLNPVDDVTDSLMEILISRGATEEQIHNITSSHREKIASYQCRKWYVKEMTWGNLFA
jgi:DNA repair exonuclease SbcCD nuclease subunit